MIRFSILLFLTLTAELAIAGSFTVNQQTLVSSRRVTNVLSNFVYEVTIRNNGNDASSVIATVKSTDPNTIVVDGGLSFGAIRSGSQGISTDTFTVLRDSRFPFNPDVLEFTFSYSVSDSGNTQPIANAGQDRTVKVNDLVTLDGINSSDPDGDTLTFSWSITSSPTQSTTVLNGSDRISPSFSVDWPGQYVVQLIVSDGQASSLPDEVIISTENSAPVAEAGPSQSKHVDDVVTLDGSDSYDVDGDILNYRWSFTNKPADSAASLSDPTSIKPEFIIDESGSYELQLIVNDGRADSQADTVNITTQNSVPVANAGNDFSTAVSQTVLLDGTASNDVDGNPLSYKWSMSSRPEGSAAKLSGPNTPQPTLLIDYPGSYGIQLIVNDGYLDSVPDTVVVTTENTIPVADAGNDQTVLVTEKVQLDGSNSSDVDLDSLNYRWSFSSKPPESKTLLINSTSQEPTFVVDYPGTYVVQLIVNDGAVDSLADTIVVTTKNSRPVANAGPDQSVFVGSQIALDGQLSFDVDFDSLEYQWSLISKPVGSVSELTATNTVASGFIPDLPGSYVLQLIVSDANVSSKPDTLLLEAKTPEVSIHSSTTSGLVPLDVTLNALPEGGYPPYEFQWDLDGNGTVDDTRQNFVHTFLQRGDYNVSLKMKDSKGYEASATQLINVNSAPLVIAAASPDAGSAPLSVNFSATVSDADGSIVKYDWDFDGDGVVDQTSAGTADATHTYRQAGLYQAKLTVFDNDGLSNSDTVAISVGSSPEVVVSADVFTGVTPLTVNFSGAVTDSDGQVVTYEWDFDGDKQFDYSNASSAEVSHVYTEGGIFNATLRVFDNDGLSDEDSVIISVAGPPSALPGAYPLSGESPLTVTFFSDGKDLDGGPEYYDWDFDGDGTFDQRLIASQNTTFTYDQPGEYHATLKVVDDDGLSSSSSITINVTEGSGNIGSPTVRAIASPTVGSTPLLATLSTRVSDDGTISKYEWDFESDGVYDFIEESVEIGLITETIDVGGYAHPTFADFDGDGDIDMVVGNSNGQMAYFQNKGSALVFEFINLGLIQEGAGSAIDIGSYAAPCAYDVDNDNDIDLLVGNSSGNIYIIENTGTKESPTWENKGAMALSGGNILDVGSYAKPIVYLIGNDADWDLLVGNSSGYIAMIENTGSDGLPVWIDKGDLQDSNAVLIDVGAYAAPHLIDHDGDGDQDLYVGENGGRIVYLENQGTDQIPSWSNRNYLPDQQGNTLDIGSYATPVTAPTSGAADRDLWIGNSSGQISWYRQVSTKPSSWQLKISPFNSADVGGYASPALVDYDDDGVLDLVVGNSDGLLRLIRNSGVNESPSFRLDHQLVDDLGDGIDVGSYAAPGFYDLDNDGDDDLLVGNSVGQFFYFQNIGTAELPNWTSRGALQQSSGTTIDIGGYATPFFVDYDQDGDMDILSGNSSGELYLIENSGSVSSPLWNVWGRLVSDDANFIDVGSYAKPLITDLNSDGILDLLVGNSNGHIYKYENVSDSSGYRWSLKETQFGKIDVGSYAAPLAVNLDGDVDEDLLIGNSSGLIYQLKSVGNIKQTYRIEGHYTATVRVTDNDGNTATDTVTLSALPAGYPTLTLSSNLKEGVVPLKVDFTAVASDPDGIINNYEWDFDGDGVYEKMGSATETFTYNTVGKYNPRVRVTDNEGKQASISLGVTASMLANFSHNAVINPGQAENSEIGIVLPSDATITLKIVDEFGNLIKTLVDKEFRSAGTHVNSWDGYDNLNNLVGDGAYYFVLSYDHNGLQGTVDLRESASFDQYTPNRTWPSTFNPYTGVPVTSTYTVNKPAEVSFYFWVRDNSRTASSIAPVRTLFIRELKDAGTHTEIWDGVDDNGVPVKPGEQYRITLWVYELPDNAIVITGGKPEISHLSVTSRTFNPQYNPYSSEPNQAESVRVAFDISKAASVEVVAINSEGQQIDRFIGSELNAGANSIRWDGRNFKNDLVPPGVYSLQLTAIDSKGNRSLQRYAIVTVRY